MPGAAPPQKSRTDGALSQVAKALVVATTAQAARCEVLDLEKTRIVSTASGRAATPVSKVLFYCGLNAIFSSALIAFNKHLMNEQRFPFAMPLVLMHTTASSICVGFFLLIHRRWSHEEAGSSGFFASLPQALADPSITSKAFCIAGLFAVQLVLSNSAYLYSSVVFIQMMKEGNLPIVYGISLCVALESFHAQRIGVLFVIVFATLITLKGELHFSWLGFLIQASGQVFEVARIVLQAVVLNARGCSLDILTYMVLVMPACAMLLGSFLTFSTCVLQLGAATPSYDLLVAWWPQLLANTLLAVVLNFSTALVLKHASAVGLVLSGIMKDTAIVIVGAYCLGESITSVQVIGFVMQIAGILVYSVMKACPETFSDGVLLGLKRVCRIEADPHASLLPTPTKRSSYESSQRQDASFKIQFPSSSE